MDKSDEDKKNEDDSILEDESKEEKLEKLFNQTLELPEFARAAIEKVILRNETLGKKESAELESYLKTIITLLQKISEEKMENNYATREDVQKEQKELRAFIATKSAFILTSFSIILAVIMGVTFGAGIYSMNNAFGALDKKIEASEKSTMAEIRVLQSEVSGLRSDIRNYVLAAHEKDNQNIEKPNRLNGKP